MALKYLNYWIIISALLKQVKIKPEIFATSGGVTSYEIRIVIWFTSMVQTDLILSCNTSSLLIKPIYITEIPASSNKYSAHSNPNLDRPPPEATRRAPIAMNKL